MVNILSYHEDWKIWTVAICFLKIERAAYEDIFAYMRIEKKGCIPHICGRTYAKCKAHMQKTTIYAKYSYMRLKTAMKTYHATAQIPLYFIFIFLYLNIVKAYGFCLFKKNNEVKSTYGRLFLKIVL